MWPFLGLIWSGESEMGKVLGRLGLSGFWWGVTGAGGFGGGDFMEMIVDDLR